MLHRFADDPQAAESIMTWNPHDPNTPGGYTDWKLHGEKYDNWGSSAGQHGTSSASAPSSLAGWTSTSSSTSSPTSTTDFTSGFVSHAIGGAAAGDGVRYSAGQSGIRHKLGVFFHFTVFAGMMFGIYDRLWNGSSADHSYNAVSKGVGSVADQLSGGIMALDLNREVTVCCMMIVKFVSLLLGFTAGIAAAVGNVGAIVVKTIGLIAISMIKSYT